MTPEQYIDTALRDLADVYGPERVLAHATLLFGVAPSNPSRAGDPETSRAAGQRKREQDVGRFSPTSWKGRLLAETARKPGTAQELALRSSDAVTVSAVEGARRRVSDLVAAGFVADSGDRRPNPGTTDLAIVWQITPVGRLALDRMLAVGWTR